MSTVAPGPSDHDGVEPPLTELERMVSRLIDGEATPEEVDSLAERAREDHTAWRLLAEMRRADWLTAHACGSTLNAMASVELPARRRESAAPVILARIGAAWSGWAIAAVLVLLVAFGVFDRSASVRTVNLEGIKPHIVQDRIGSQLDPIVTRTEKTEGGWRLTWIERWIHVVDVDTPDPQQFIQTVPNPPDLAEFRDTPNKH